MKAETALSRLPNQAWLEQQHPGFYRQLRARLERGEELVPQADTRQFAEVWTEVREELVDVLAWALLATPADHGKNLVCDLARALSVLWVLAGGSDHE